MKILFCDDDPVIRYLLEVVLGKKAGHEVVAISDSSEVVDTAAVEHPDVILLDYVMPGPSGIEIARRLRQVPETMGIPVVFLTGRADIADEAELESLNVIDVIEKPFDTAKLADRLTAGVTAHRS